MRGRTLAPDFGSVAVNRPDPKRAVEAPRAAPDSGASPDAVPGAVAARGRLRDRVTTGLARALIARVRAARWPAVLAQGARLGDLGHALGLRRNVARENLARAFPQLEPAARARILREHYRELGRVCIEYARLAELSRAAEGEVLTRIEGLEHLMRARDEGRGAILLTGHFGSFELLGAWLARYHPVDFVVQTLSNPGMDAWIRAERSAAGVGQIPIGAGMRGALAALRANRWVAMLADQDARSHGVFVPFFGRLASTPVGPASLSLRTGAPIVMGFDRRLPDGRHVLVVEPAVTITDPEASDAALRLTAAHTARLEARVREQPESWFWLHRRWKTPPP